MKQRRCRVLHEGGVRNKRTMRRLARLGKHVIAHADARPATKSSRAYMAPSENTASFKRRDGPSAAQRLVSQAPRGYVTWHMSAVASAPWIPGDRCFIVSSPVSVVVARGAFEEEGEGEGEFDRLQLGYQKSQQRLIRCRQPNVHCLQ